MSIYQFKKGTALITGATSGIGAEFARQLAGKGMGLVLTGRRMEKLKALAAELSKQFGVKCQAVKAELTLEADRKKVEKLILATPDLDVLVNNAGYGHVGTFAKTSPDELVDMITVHDTAAVRFTRAALPAMLRRKSGAVICTSSLAAYIPTPEGPLYGATKVFLNSFTEALHILYRGSGVRFQALCPGFTHTDFHEKTGMPRTEQTSHGFIRWMEPDAIVKKSLIDLKKGRVICVPGKFYRLLALLIGLVPRRLLYVFLKGR